MIFKESRLLQVHVFKEKVSHLEGLSEHNYVGQAVQFENIFNQSATLYIVSLIVHIELFNHDSIEKKNHFIFITYQTYLFGSEFIEFNFFDSALVARHSHILATIYPC